MLFLPDKAWYLGEKRYKFFLSYNGEYTSVTIEAGNNDKPPKVKRFKNESSKNADLMILEADTDSVEINEQDFRINWDFTDTGLLGVKFFHSPQSCQFDESSD